jgi:hypothetical protein
MHPPAGVTRPTGAAGITVLDHFGTWTGSGTTTARVDADLDDFTRLWYGNFLVRDTHFSTAAGSTAITLTEAFHTPLADGTYSFLAEFSDGHAYPVNLIINRAFGDVPQTGVPGITPMILTLGIGLYLTLTTGAMLYFHLRGKRRTTLGGKNIEKAQS